LPAELVFIFVIEAKYRRSFATAAAGALKALGGNFKF
jgi:hypothetical protein